MKDGKNLSKKIQRILTARRSKGRKAWGQNECALRKSTKKNIFMVESLEKNLVI